MNNNYCQTFKLNDNLKDKKTKNSNFLQEKIQNSARNPVLELKTKRLRLKK